MKISARLLFTLIFCALVLPFIVKFFGFGGLEQQNEIKKTEKREIAKIKEGASSYKDQLLASIDQMSLEDAALKKCIVDAVSKYFGVSDSKGLLQSAADLKHLDCHRQKITSLEGIESLKKLESISLTDNNVEDASPLAKTYSLKSINLSYGNSDIRNIEELAQLNNLTSIQFPDLKQTFCYEVDRIVQSMRDNSDSKVNHNSKSIDCRGKKTGLVTRALAKQSRDKELTDAESEALSDYEENQRWSN